MQLVLDQFDNIVTNVVPWKVFPQPRYIDEL